MKNRITRNIGMLALVGAVGLGSYDLGRTSGNREMQKSIASEISETASFYNGLSNMDNIGESVRDLYENRARELQSTGELVEGSLPWVFLPERYKPKVERIPIGTNTDSISIGSKRRVF